MESVLAIDDPRAAGGRASELDRRLDRFRSRIQEQCFVEIRHMRQQPLGENARERRYIHLNEIGKFAIENALQRLAQRRVITTNGEDAKAAQQVEIASALSIVEILPLAATKPDIVADRLEDPNHLLV